VHYGSCWVFPEVKVGDGTLSVLSSYTTNRMDLGGSPGLEPELLEPESKEPLPGAPGKAGMLGGPPEIGERLRIGFF
jgi:hypothetical protein